MPRFYIKGADKSACIVNINGIQKAARSYQNLNPTVDEGDALDITAFSGTAAAPDQEAPLPVLPVCPTADTDYTLAANFPAAGTPVAVCADATYGGTTTEAQTDGDIHAPQSTDGW